MTRHYADQNPLTDWLAQHTGWPLAFTLLILAIAAAALLIAHALAALADKPEPREAEFESWARPVTVHHGDKPLPRLRIDDDTARRWRDAAEAMERASIEDTVRQAEDHLADRPYNQEEDR